MLTFSVALLSHVSPAGTCRSKIFIGRSHFPKLRGIFAKCTVSTRFTGYIFNHLFWAVYFLTAHMAEKNVMGKDLYQSQVYTI